MVFIFVSHSQYDTEIRDFFTNIIAAAPGVDAEPVEFERIGPYPALTIMKKMVNPITRAIFVLLGPGLLRSQYTINWVAFEVGLAAGLRKDVWVFEQFGANIQFPVPYVNHYVLYDIGNKDHFQFIKERASGYTMVFPVMRNSIILKHNPAFVECRYENCGASYYFHSRAEKFNCPACRQLLVEKKPGLIEPQ